MPAALLVSKSPPLCGELTVHGAKNSVLPILAATLLCRTPCVLHNCPDILDVTHTLQILRHLGCSCERSGSTLSIDPRGFAETPSHRRSQAPCAPRASFSARSWPGPGRPR